MFPRAKSTPVLPVLKKGVVQKIRKPHNIGICVILLEIGMTMKSMVKIVKVVLFFSVLCVI